MGEPRSSGRLQAARPGWGSLPRGTVGRGRPGPRFWRGRGHSLSWDPVPTPCTPRAPPSLATTAGSGVGWLCSLTSLSPDAPPPVAASVSAGHAGSVFTSIAGARVTSRAIPEYLSPVPPTPLPPTKIKKIKKRNKNNEGTSRETGVLLLIMHVTLTVRPGPATPDTLPGSRRQAGGMESSKFFKLTFLVIKSCLFQQ